jgi:hypothetical protein
MSWKPEEIAYCTNVHAGDSLTEVMHNLDQFVGPVRQSVHLDTMHSGLWLSYKASKELKSQFYRDSLKKCLSDNNLALSTLNGFPFGNFHQHVIKETVYLPDWSQQSRLDYTLSLASILADCLGHDNPYGTISTLPLGFKKSWTVDKHNSAINLLLLLVKALEKLESRSAKQIRVCIEMEPACVLEKTDELIKFFSVDLKEAATAAGIEQSLLRRYLGVCYDVCHQAVWFEDIPSSLRAITQADIQIGKIQLSSALLVKGCSTREIKKQLFTFAEPRYLHQTTVKMSTGEILFFDDLATALKDVDDEDAGQEWRVHYHVPLQLSSLNQQGLCTTQFATEAVFEYLATVPHMKPHLEVETYTWSVLPEHLRPVDDHSLVKGISAELQFIYTLMRRHQLLTMDPLTKNA